MEWGKRRPDPDNLLAQELNSPRYNGSTQYHVESDALDIFATRAKGADVSCVVR